MDLNQTWPHPIYSLAVKSTSIKWYYINRNFFIFDLPHDCVIILCFTVDDKAWQKDEEFSREFLAGLNPVIIALVKVILIAPIPPSSNSNSANFQRSALIRHKVCKFALIKNLWVLSISGKVDLQFPLCL